MKDESSSDWLTTEELARYMKTSKSKLDKDRCSGHLGIPFHKSGRSVLYNRQEIDAWLYSHGYKSTSEYPTTKVQANDL